jgi:hypothetical protein
VSTNDEIAHQIMHVHNERREAIVAIILALQEAEQLGTIDAYEHMRALHWLKEVTDS